MWSTSRAENRLLDEEFLPKDFHMPGIEPWIAQVMKQHELGTVLDLGVGMGFWGYLIRSYITRGSSNNPILIGIDVDREKLSQIKRMNVYDELICSDIRHLPFKPNVFNTILAVESLYMQDFQDILKALEALAKHRGLIILSKGIGKEARKELLREGYEIYRVCLRGLMLTRVKDGKSFFAIKALKYVAPIVKLCYKILPIKAKDYSIAIKSVSKL